MIYIFDGAMGTMLQEAGLPAGYCPELWNIENPEKVTAIHRKYVQNGADIIETNTFGGSRIKLDHYGLGDKVAAINIAAVKAARAACGPSTKIAGSIGPTGKFIEPLGDLSFQTAYEIFKEQITALEEGGVDLFIIETIIDIQEMRAALLAAKEVTAKPVICQLSYGADGRTLTGTDPRTAAIILEAMGADVIGANCSLGPAQLLPIISELAENCKKPISVQPNAGMPKLVDGRTVFPMGPEEMASWIPKLLSAGASYIGGCCGTTPSHIKAVSETAKNSFATNKYDHFYQTALTSRNKTVYLGAGLPTAVIGERINPTGRKAMAADIKAGNFGTVKKEALQQIQAGAKILDVNMGVPGIDQATTMKRVVEDLSLLTDVPLSIDTTDPASLEAGLRAFPGRALVNSVSAEPERLETFLPLAKKYGAAVLCLPIAPGGVPTTAAEKIKIVRTIVEAAHSAGLRDQDLLLDALVMTVATDPEAAKETLETLRLYRHHFGYPAVMGLSNISFGLPRRDLMNATFCAMALQAGLDAPILNPYDKMMQDILSSSAALLGFDASGKDYSLKFAAASAKAPINPAPAIDPGDILTLIKQTVIRGEKEAIPALIKKALEEKHPPLTITNQALTAAMNEIGDAFGEGRCYLPQVLLAAETMRSAFLTIKELLPSHSTATAGKVILATVKGDIHDLGKNIVAALLENNGFEVIDLGKDVDPKDIVDAALAENADIIGLCALMTTTLPQIDATIAALKTAAVKTPVIVGGAVLTAEYAKQAGADGYAANGVDAVKLAKKIINN